MQRALLVLLICLAAAPLSRAQQQETAYSPPAPTASTAAAADYRLGPGDELRVSVFNEADMSLEAQRVSAQGGISMPLIGEVNAAGMTTTELQRAIEARLQNGYLRQPRVAVSVITYRPFFVVGEVARPGPYPFAANLNVGSAIATAGGFARGASRSSVYVRREGATEEQRVAVSSGVALHPGDTVRVGRGALSAIRDLPIGWLGLLP